MANDRTCVWWERVWHEHWWCQIPTHTLTLCGQQVRSQGWTWLSGSVACCAAVPTSWNWALSRPSLLVDMWRISGSLRHVSRVSGSHVTCFWITASRASCFPAPGWSGSGRTGFCFNVLECTNGGHNCDVNADCVDTEGSFYCVCNPGTEGWGGAGRGGAGQGGASTPRAPSTASAIRVLTLRRFWPMGAASLHNQCLMPSPCTCQRREPSIVLYFRKNTSNRCHFSLASQWVLYPCPSLCTAAENNQ